MQRLLVFSCLIALGGCPSRQADTSWLPATATDLGPVVARVGAVPIHANQVLAEVRRTGKSPRSALENLVDTQLLAESARGRGRRPVASSDHEVKNALVQRILERELEPLLRPEAVPDSALRPIYERGKAAFVHSRLVQVGVLVIDTGDFMKPEPRKAREQAAKELAAYLQQNPPKSLEAFAEIARDPAWSGRHVVYSQLLQSLDTPLSRSVGEEIAKLKAPGEMTRQLSDENGFYVARYISERPAENVSFEQARPKLVEGYLERWRRKQFVDYTTRLMQAHKTAAYFDRLNEEGL